MTLPALFDRSLIDRREQVGIEVDAPDGGVRTLTFGELDERANRMAHALVSLGCRQGDRLSVHLANRLEFIDLFLACLRLGVVFVPVNVLYREREIAHITADSEPKIAVTSPEHVALFPSGTRVVTVDDLGRAAAASPPDAVRAPLKGDDPAALVYTSGTTGRSKGAVLSHRNFLANTTNLLSAWRITSDDRYLAVLPLFHVPGLGNGVCSWLASGCRMRLVERFEHQRIAGLFAEFRPTLFFGVPTMYVRLVDLPADVARRIGEGMRLFVSGSAPLASHVLERFHDAFGHTILERYGMSETLMIASNPYDGERRAGSVGLPLPGVSVRIARADGTPAPDGDVGELHVRGPNVFSGYWRNDAATAAAFDGPWFRTGDLAERAPDGYYTLRGRATDLIISGGFNIDPLEIEDLLLELPGVREVVVVGVPDERRGEVPVAYVVAGAGFDDTTAHAECARQLASFKVPRAFVRVETLPRNALGKVQRHLLPAWSPA